MRFPVLLLAVMATPLGAQEPALDAPPMGSISRAEGLEAWGRIYEVVSHPRCANCHVGPSNIPVWSGPSYGETQPHGLNITAGDSRIGAEHIPCSTCHTTKQTDWKDANETPHAAPRVAASWHLPPVDFAWFDKTSGEVCAQLSDPDRNGGLDAMGLAEHVNHCPLVHWGWAPGGGREAAPYSIDAHTRDILLWGAAAMPCPE